MKRVSAILLLIMFLSAGCTGPTMPAPEPTPSTIPTPTPVSQTITTWLSAGPREVQFTSDFQLVQMLRDEEVYYADFKLTSNGKDIYALRMPSYPDRYASLVRLYSSEEEDYLQREEVLNFNELVNPNLWDPGINLSEAGIGVALFNSGDDLLSVARNGDLFLAACAWSVDSPRGAPPLGVSLIVIHPDGSRQKVITIQELGESGLLDLSNADRGASLAVSASAPDCLWVKTETFPTGAMGFTSFYQVLDPNSDGDWSDRTILHLSMPSFLLAGEGEEKWWNLQQMVSEPSLAGEDYSRSFLLPVINQQGEFRIYRISDLNHDGDALDNGELDLVFKGLTASPAAHGGRPVIIAPRMIVRNGELALRELVVSSFTGLSRISRLSEEGELIDIARAFSNFEDLLTDTEGNIYVVTQLPQLEEEGIQFVIYKLRPLAEGEKTEPSLVTVTTEPSTPELITGAITPEVPMIAFTRSAYGHGEEKEEVYLIGADGSGPSKLLQGAHNSLCCQSPDGSRMFYFSDEEIPHEQFVYVANADGSNPEKITENPRVTSICGFTEERLLLTVGAMFPATIIQHDLKTGKETILLTDVPEWSVSPDGRHLAFVSGLDYTKIPTTYLPSGDESLEILDLDTGERRLLHGPLKDMSYLRFWWSPNGQQLGYLIGPWRHKQSTSRSGDFQLYVTDLSSGDAKLVYRAEGIRSQPAVTWSPSGSWLLVKVEHEAPIEEDIPEFEEQENSQSNPRMGLVQERLLVNAKTGEVYPWQVEGENVVRYGWASNEDSLVYRVGENLYSQSVDGNVQKLATIFGDECYDYGFIGWSHDGRYIGLSGDWQSLAILDTTTGEAHILFREERENTYIFPYGWW